MHVPEERGRRSAAARHRAAPQVGLHRRRLQQAPACRGHQARACLSGGGQRQVAHVVKLQREHLPAAQHLACRGGKAGRRHAVQQLMKQSN